VYILLIKFGCFSVVKPEEVLVCAYSLKMLGLL
jgi:hypothetical protein